MIPGPSGCGAPHARFLAVSSADAARWQKALIERNVVTDPYSVGLSTNSERSLIVNLADPALAPATTSSPATHGTLRPCRMPSHAAPAPSSAQTLAVVPALKGIALNAEG